GTFPVDALLKQRNRVTVPPDIEDTVPDQPRVYDASDAGWTTSDPLNLDYAASRAIAASELAAAEERGLLGSDQVPTPVPDPAHLANLLDQAITEAKPLASTDRSDAVQQDSTAGFAVAQLKVAKLETTREELLAANLRKHGSDAKKSIEAPV